jgi:hypothetical protein
MTWEERIIKRKKAAGQLFRFAAGRGILLVNGVSVWARGIVRLEHLPADGTATVRVFLTADSRIGLVAHYVHRLLWHDTFSRL